MRREVIYFGQSPIDKRIVGKEDWIGCLVILFTNPLPYLDGNGNQLVLTVAVEQTDWGWGKIILSWLEAIHNF